LSAYCVDSVSQAAKVRLEDL